MVEAVSSGPVEGEQVTISACEETKVEETPKEKPSSSPSVRDQLNIFLDKGGEQAAYRKIGQFGTHVTSLGLPGYNTRFYLSFIPSIILRALSLSGFNSRDFK